MARTQTVEEVIKEATAKMNLRHPMGASVEYADFQIQVAILREIAGLREDLRKVMNNATRT